MQSSEHHQQQQPVLALSLPPSPPSTSSSSSHSSSHHPTQQHHHHSYAYSSYPSTPLASFFPPPSSSSSFFPEVDTTLKLNRKRRATLGSGEVDAFGMGGFFVDVDGSGDARGWGWVGAGEESEEESELEEEEDGEEQGTLMFQEVVWGGKVEDKEPESPILETTFGWAGAEEEKGESKIGVAEVQEDDDEASSTSTFSPSSILAYLPSPTGTFQHVEHHDGLLRSFSSNNLLAEFDFTREDQAAAELLNNGGRGKVGAGVGGGGWRGWIGV